MAIALAGDLAFAQQAAKPGKPNAIEEITVTAERRSQNLQRVPVADTALTAAELEKRKVADLQELRFYVPGLQTYSTSPGIVNYSIRGLGNNNNRGATADGSVGFFQDEVYIGRPYLVNNNFLDVARIEVLRGPQGTLFGRNTIGGAILFVSREPGDELRAGADLTAGNYNAIGANGFISAPLSDTVSGKVAVNFHQHDGYAYNTTAQSDQDDERFIGASAALRFRPSQDWDIALNVDGSQRRGNGGWWILTQPCILACATSGQNQPGKPYANPRVGNAPNDPGFGNIDNFGVSLNAKWTIPIGLITSISSYRDGKLDSRSPSVGTAPAPLGFTLGAQNAVSGSWPLSDILFTQEDDYRTKQYSEEIRLSSNDEGRFNWVLGGFYYHESSPHTVIVDFQYNLYFGGFGGRTRYDSRGTLDSYAGFGNVSYKITEALKIQGGLRYSKDEKSTLEVPSGRSYSSGFTAFGKSVSTFTATGQKSWASVTPSATVSYQIAPTAFAYATVSQGFKSGGFQDNATELVAAQTPYKPEEVTNYEIGAKTDWLDRRLRVNVAAFYLQYKNLQTAELIPNPAPGGGPNLTVLGNAGKAHNQGVEIEVQFLPIERLELFASVAAQSAKIDNLISSTGVNQAGYPIPFSPPSKYSLGGAYTADLGPADLTGRVSYAYTGTYWATVTRAAGNQVPSQSTVDASLLLAPHGQRWTLEMWGRNLQDKLNGTSVFTIFNSQYLRVGNPRTFGATLHLSY